MITLFEKLFHLAAEIFFVVLKFFIVKLMSALRVTARIQLSRTV